MARGGRRAGTGTTAQDIQDALVKGHHQKAQTIRTWEDAENWLARRGLKPKEKYDTQFAVRKLQRHPDFDALSMDDKVRLREQLRRVPRERTYEDSRLVKGGNSIQGRRNSKATVELGIRDRKNDKSGKSPIITEDTIIGCCRGCAGCYSAGNETFRIGDALLCLFI